ncbi:MAG: Fe-S cluster assembly sulfur transfer protein SufU [Candidatus Polarisedimenticolia bacterium]
MSFELDELYRETILDHYKSPRGAKPLAHPTASEEGYNPLCGDEVTLEIELDGDVVKDVSVRGKGCSISVASGSLLAQELRGKPIAEARNIAASFKAMLQGEGPADEDVLGDLTVLEGVKSFPVRIKCALLPWTTLEQALDKK